MEIKRSHPKGLYILTFGEFWDRFSFFGILTILILYLTKMFSLSDMSSYLLYGVYLALSFSTPIVGGYLADRFLGFHRAIITGALFLIFGNLFLMIRELHFFYFGLALLICGIGLYKPNCTGLVGTLYKQQDPLRNSGFTIFYAGMNVGAVLGPIVFGLMAYFFGWQYGFLCGAIGMAVWLIIYLLKMSNFKIDQKKCQRHLLCYSLIYFGSISIAVLICFAFCYPKFFSNFLVIFGIIAFIFLVILAIKQDIFVRRRMLGILILDVFCIFFFATSLQVGSSVTLFIQRHVDRVLFGWKVPTMMFGSLDPLFVVLMAPFFAFLWAYLSKKRCDPSVFIKMFYGLLLAAIGFFGFMLAAKMTGVQANGVVFLCLILGYLFLGAGEICLTPAILSAISEYLPAKLQGTMMGAWFLSIAFAGMIGGWLSKITAPGEKILVNITSYDQTFFIIAIFILIPAGLILILKKYVRELFE